MIDFVISKPGNINNLKTLKMNLKDIHKLMFIVHEKYIII